MKKLTKILCILAGGAAAAAGAATYLIAPGKASKEKKAAFFGRNIAHRGMHTTDRSVPENSMASFCRASELGYGVELDIQMTKDEKLVVFHDDDIFRMCGVHGRISEMDYADLKKLPLLDSAEKIPLLSEVLRALGDVPVVAAFKRGKRNDRMCELALEMLDFYKGEYCVESFDPTIVRWWRKNAPDILRGQMACTMKGFSANTSRPLAFCMSMLFMNFMGRPHFISYGLGEKKPFTVRLCEKMGAMPVAWTSRSASSEEGNDMVIFEFYNPEVRYK